MANLANLLVGLGYDLSALEKGAPEAFALINKQTLGMSAEMKRTSREGAESLRLISESLGVHVSRPISRILTQTFPAFAEGLSAILGAGVVGVLATVGVEAFEKISKSIEKAEKAQEAFAESTRKARETFEDIMASFEKSEKLHSLSGVAKQLFEIDSSSVEETRKKIDQLSKALQDNAKAAAEANGTWTKLAASVGEFFTMQSTIDLKKINDQLAEFQHKYDDLARTDALKGTHQGAKALNEELEKANAKLSQMQAQLAAQSHTTAPTFNGIPIHESPLMTKELIDDQKAVIEGYKQMNKIQSAGDSDKAAKETEVFRDRIQAADEAVQKFAAKLVQLREASLPAKDAFVQIEDELNKQIISTTRLNQLIGDDAFYAKYNAHLADVLQQFVLLNMAKADSIELDGLLKKGLPGGTAGIAPPPNVGSTGAAPQLSSGGTLGAQLEDFKKNFAARDALAAQAFQQALTPIQRYNETIAKLNIALKDAKGNFIAGAQGQAAFNAAAEKAVEQLRREELQLGRMKDGLRSFFAEMNAQNSTARFTFDILTQGLRGFEDETAKALTGAKTDWRGFFLELDQMALKFFLNKAIMALLGKLGGSLLGGIGGSGGGGGGGDAFGGTGEFALGTDFAPGGRALVGEFGPEEVNLPRGSSVTPNSSMRGGTHQWFIDNRGASVDAVARLERLIPIMRDQAVQIAVSTVSEVQKRTPR